MSAHPAPSSVLPHRAPFLFVDVIDELVVGSRAVGRWKLRGDEWFFPGHFPGRPTLPGVLMCEAIAQVGAYALLLADPSRNSKLPLFGGLDAARFRRQVVPGDELVITAELGRLSARAGKGGGSVTVNGKLACECELMFVLVDR
jgi:3-hydroxyacyl-[acyl-carrier-protein] dehydratase